MKEFAFLWFSFGATGAWLAYRGSIARFGRDIYGWKLYTVTVLGGIPAFFGSIVAWK